MKRYLLFFIIFFTISIASAQTLDSSCYYFRSTYYKGDWVQLCLKKNGDFYYQRHQYDVMGDSYSTGTWQNINDTICLTSTNHPEPFYSIQESGPPFHDTLNIEFLTKRDKTFIEYCNIVLLDQRKQKIEDQFVEAGFISLVIPVSTKFLTIQSLIIPQFDIDLSLIAKRDIQFLVDASMNRFENVSHLKFLKDNNGNLVYVDKKGNRTIYNLEK